jgi:hypothetical protein
MISRLNLLQWRATVAKICSVEYSDEGLVPLLIENKMNVTQSFTYKYVYFMSIEIATTSSHGFPLNISVGGAFPHIFDLSWSSISEFPLKFRTMWNRGGSFLHWEKPIRTISINIMNKDYNLYVLCI